MAQETPPSLPPEHVDALNNVDLQMSFGTHGYLEVHPDHGLMTLGVTDREYQAVEKFVGDMSAERGDVLAVEGIGYIDSPTNHLVSQGFSLVESLSPFLRDETSRALEKLDPDALARYYRLARDLRILTPIDYAEGKATERGIAVHYADADAATMDAWERKNWGKRNTDFRNGHMVLSLGRIANGMNPGSERPKLKFVAGSDHRRGIERLLDDAGVQYSSTLFSPRRRLHNGIRDAQSHGHMVAPRVVPSPVKREIAAWERNLRSKHAR